MIPRDFITAWRAEAPWIEDAQVEQDLVISKALVDIFSNPVLKDALAFRGGTALYKLFLKPAARYSEDIDLVQVNAEPVGDIMTALRDVLTPWLDDSPRYKQSEGRVTFRFRFPSEDAPPLPLTLKVEINTREHLGSPLFPKCACTYHRPWGRCFYMWNLPFRLYLRLRCLWRTIRFLASCAIRRG